MAGEPIIRLVGLGCAAAPARQPPGDAKRPRKGLGQGHDRGQQSNARIGAAARLTGCYADCGEIGKGVQRSPDDLKATAI